MFAWMKKVFLGITCEAYCFTCRCDRKIDKLKTIMLSNGTKTQQGVCIDCGTKLSKFMGKA